MLERQIEELRVAVELNTLALENLRVLLVMGLPESKQAPATDRPEPKQEAQPIETEEAKLSPEEEKLDAESIKQLALEIIRVDRTKKTVIKDLVSSLGGSNLLSVPTQNLPERKARLEEMQ